MATKTLDRDVLWKWEDSLDEALRQQLLSAVESTWPFAHMTAWSYLHDEAQAAEIVEEALEVVRAYAIRSSPAPTTQKLTARLRSQIRRIGKQRANRIKEEPIGSLDDLDSLLQPHFHDPWEQVFLEQVLAELTPRARDVAAWLQMGYSWREIGATFELDHSSLRRAFKREGAAALLKLRNANRNDV